MFRRGADARFYLMVLHPLRDYIDYLDEAEANLEKQKLKLIEMSKELDDEEQDEFWDWYIDDYYTYSELYPSILKTSVFISIYSFFEYQLLKQCTNKEILSSIKDKGIDKGKEYFKKVFGIHSPFQSENWKFIKDCNKIRNVIVHNGGNMDTILDENKQQEIRNIISRVPGLNISKHGNILIENEFCKRFYEAVRDLLIDLYNEKKGTRNK
jgi:hypothetical protein